MRGLMEKGHQVHVLTGNPEAPRVLEQLGIGRGREYTTVATVPLKNIAAVKVAYMQHVGATHLVDNRKANVKAARNAGFTAHHHMGPKQKD
jgi:hypothetical protein